MVVFLMGLGESQKPFASLTFSTGLLDIPLQSGFYNNAERSPFESAGHPGLAFFFDGRGCNTLTGNFTIHEFSHSPTLGIQSFSATFEQHCEGAAPALFGTFSYQIPEPSVLSLALVAVVVVRRSTSRRRLAAANGST